MVCYAAECKAADVGANYWDYATLLEIAVLTRDRVASEAALADELALVKMEALWEPDATVSTIMIIQQARAARGEYTA